MTVWGGGTTCSNFRKSSLARRDYSDRQKSYPQTCARRALVHARRMYFSLRNSRIHKRQVRPQNGIVEGAHVRRMYFSLGNSRICKRVCRQRCTPKLKDFDFFTGISMLFGTCTNYDQKSRSRSRGVQNCRISIPTLGGKQTFFCFWPSVALEFLQLTTPPLRKRDF